MTAELVETPRVATVNVAVVAPAATVTDAGTVAFVVSELTSVVMTPPVLALPFRVTVPVEVVPETTEAGFKVTVAMSAGLTVIGAVAWICCFTAEIVTGVATATPSVVTVKMAEVEPAATVTDAGTVAVAVLELER